MIWTRPSARTTAYSLHCPQIDSEATEYYWAQNTIFLSLIHPSDAPNRFAKGTQDILKYLQRTQNLELEIGNLQLDGSDVYSLTDYGCEQWNWFLQTLGQAKTGRGDKLLKTLTLIDFSVYEYYPPNVPALAKGRKYVELRDVRKREALATASRPLCGRIGKTMIKTIAQLRQTNGWRGS